MLAACGSLPEADCQVRAGTLEGEFGYDPFGRSTGQGGAASLVGTPESCKNFRVYTRGAGGSEVCYDGVDPTSGWCERERPITIEATRTQLRDLLDDREAE